MTASLLFIGKPDWKPSVPFASLTEGLMEFGIVSDLWLRRKVTHWVDVFLCERHTSGQTQGPGPRFPSGLRIASSKCDPKCRIADAADKKQE